MRIRLVCASIAAAIALVGTAAMSQAVRCGPNEDALVEFDFALAEDGTPTLKLYPRVYGRTCTSQGQGQITLRGVQGKLDPKNTEAAWDAVRGAELLLRSGISDVESIRQLVARVKSATEADAKRPKQVAAPTGASDPLTSIFNGPEAKKK